MAMRRVLAILLLVLAAGVARAETVPFPRSRSAACRPGRRSPPRLDKPSGPGPFPAIVLAHSCSGVRTAHRGWAQRSVKWGYCRADARQLQSARHQGGVHRGRTGDANMRVADIAGALDFLATRPYVRKGAIAMIGHSHGASTTMRSLQKMFDLKARGLRGGVAYYPAATARSSPASTCRC
jgi:dienelactone hydrolase